MVGILLTTREILFAVNRATDDPLMLVAEGCTAVTLMHIAIKNQYLVYLMACDGISGREDKVVENTIAAAKIVMGVMVAPREMQGNTLIYG